MGGRKSGEGNKEEARWEPERENPYDAKKTPQNPRMKREKFSRKDPHKP